MEEILHQLIGSLARYLQGFTHPEVVQVLQIKIIKVYGAKDVYNNPGHCYLFYFRKLQNIELPVTTVANALSNLPTTTLKIWIRRPCVVFETCSRSEPG